MEDVQCSWLLLLLCGSTRADYTLRSLPPELFESSAIAHDENVWTCFQALMKQEVGDHAREMAQLPFREGGLGLKSAQRCAPAAYWA